MFLKGSLYARLNLLINKHALQLLFRMYSTYSIRAYIWFFLLLYYVLYCFCFCYAYWQCFCSFFFVKLHRNSHILFLIYRHPYTILKGASLQIRMARKYYNWNRNIILKIGRSLCGKVFSYMRKCGKFWSYICDSSVKQGSLCLLNKRGRSKWWKETFNTNSKLTRSRVYGNLF